MLCNSVRAVFVRVLFTDSALEVATQLVQLEDVCQIHEELEQPRDVISHASQLNFLAVASLCACFLRRESIISRGS